MQIPTRKSNRKGKRKIEYNIYQNNSNMNLSTVAILLFLAGSAWCKGEEVGEDGKKNLRGLLEFDSSSSGSSTCVSPPEEPMYVESCDGVGDRNLVATNMNMNRELALPALASLAGFCLATATGTTVVGSAMYELTKPDCNDWITIYQLCSTAIACAPVAPPPLTVVVGVTCAAHLDVPFPTPLTPTIMQQIEDKVTAAFDKCEQGFEKVFVNTIYAPDESGGIEPDDPGADCPRWKWRQGINIDPPDGLRQIIPDVKQMCLSTDCYLPDALLKGWQWCAREKGGSSGSTEEQMACTRKCMEMIRSTVINICSNIAQQQQQQPQLPKQQA